MKQKGSSDVKGSLWNHLDKNVLLWYREAPLFLRVLVLLFPFQFPLRDPFLLFSFPISSTLHISSCFPFPLLFPFTISSFSHLFSFFYGLLYYSFISSLLNLFSPYFFPQVFYHSFSLSNLFSSYFPISLPYFILVSSLPFHSLINVPQTQHI